MQFGSETESLKGEGWKHGKDSSSMKGENWRLMKGAMDPNDVEKTVFIKHFFANSLKNLENHSFSGSSNMF